jgi:hypothetical protein
MPRKTILLHHDDNVATAIADLKKGKKVNASLDDISIDVLLSEDVAFGHKIALADIAKGQEVFKYGMPIGKALRDIRAGEWVHVHNCRSDRWGSQREKYGLRA